MTYYDVKTPKRLEEPFPVMDNVSMALKIDFITTVLGNSYDVVYVR